MNKLILIIISIFVAAGIVLALCYWGVVVEPNQLKVNKIDVSISGFKKDASIKIGIFSDLHLKGDYSRLEKAVKLINKEKPDIIVNLGDYHSYTIARSGMDTKKISKILSGLKANYGVYSIIGNHDGLLITNQMVDGNFKTLENQRKMVEDIIEDAGIKYLDDSFQVLDIRDNKFVLVGLVDKYSASRTYGELVINNLLKEPEYPNINKVMKEIPDDLPVILLNHAPDIFPDVPDRVDLTLCGHTHGGHVDLPVIRDLLIPSYYSGRYVKGLYKEGNKQLFITTGVGGLSLRINAPPEVVIMTINGE